MVDHHGEMDDAPEPGPIRMLRRLVTALLVVLILAVLAVAATIVIRLGFGFSAETGRGAAPGLATGPVEAAAFAVPGDHSVEAVGRGPGSVLFVLRGPGGQRALHVFDDQSGERLSVTGLAPP